MLSVRGSAFLSIFCVLTASPGFFQSMENAVLCSKSGVLQNLHEQGERGFTVRSNNGVRSRSETFSFTREYGATAGKLLRSLPAETWADCSLWALTVTSAVTFRHVESSKSLILQVLLMLARWILYPLFSKRGRERHFLQALAFPSQPFPRSGVSFSRRGNIWETR